MKVTLKKVTLVVGVLCLQMNVSLANNNEGEP